MPRAPAVSETCRTLSHDVYSSLLARARSRPGPMYPLHVGDTYREPWPELRPESLPPTPRLYNYAPVRGEPTLLEAIRERLRRDHDVEVPTESVQVTIGATGGLSVAAQTVLDPGDEVIVLAPYWPLIRGIVAARGARAVELPFFDRVADAAFDPERALEEAVSERTVALYVNTPNNPTGHVLDAGVLEVLVRFARKHDLWLWSDEAYAALAFGPLPAPLWRRAPERSLAFYTASKSYGVAGARVGWVHGPEAVMRAISGVQTFSTYCAPRPLQQGVARALLHAGDWLDSAREAYQLAARAAAERLGLPVPAGGTFLFFDVSATPAGRDGIEGFLERAMEAGVLLTPGAASGQAYESWARLCYSAVPPDELDDALLRLAPLVSGGAQRVLPEL